MVIIAGCIIKKDNKILMVKEAKESCYGQWNFPAGHVEKFEKITDAAIRETYEETGCKVKLIGVLPIMSKAKQQETLFFFNFIADLLEENIEYSGKEILDVQWIEIEKIKNMRYEELRDYQMTMQEIEYIENNEIYPLEIFNNQKIF